MSKLSYTIELRVEIAHDSLCGFRSRKLETRSEWFSAGWPARELPCTQGGASLSDSKPATQVGNEGVYPNLMFLSLQLVGATFASGGEAEMQGTR